jgi:hypothetical protein
MPFNLKQLLKQARKPIVVSKQEEPKKEPVLESEQTIEIPEYYTGVEHEIEDDNSAPIVRKVKNKDIVRKVPLNPLSDL